MPRPEVVNQDRATFRPEAVNQDPAVNDDNNDNSTDAMDLGDVSQNNDVDHDHEKHEKARKRAGSESSTESKDTYNKNVWGNKSVSFKGVAPLADGAEGDAKVSV